ncbi:MAG: thioredoxin domain-containing protein, partial [Candidatus Brocadiia bacterium]|nr:thioredoxin domain-containing protein [Candidatus Brocadiia bacterium]
MNSKTMKRIFLLAAFFLVLCGAVLLRMSVMAAMQTADQKDAQGAHLREPLPPPEEIARLPADGGAEFNRLIFQKSPYLLQHARNPVDWYAWGDEAFERARSEGKPIFLSIGYSTCHWCHVMERESFESEEIAAILNEYFVSIKVDREERPDVDSIYMGVCQAMTGAGGWPLTIIMTPERLPFFAGTYFPPKSRLGRPGLTEVLTQVAEKWRTDRKRMQSTAEAVVAFMREQLSRDKRGGELGEAALKTAYDQLRDRFDDEWGGFGTAPKFPTPHNFAFMLRWWRRSGDPEALEMVLASLRRMRLGGIHDHVGFGFHRYSTDREWLVPHFEKMLYDQALLTMAYAEAYQATRDPFYAEPAREIITYVLRDMRSPEGAFYSAEDADSEGEEGRFYTWTLEEWNEVLGRKDGDLFADAFGITRKGNYTDEATRGRTGRNIPHLKEPLDALAAREGLAPEELARRWDAARAKLLAVRSRRVRPYRDDKVLTAWNGLMIAALARASRALDEPAYARAAAEAADFVLENLRRPDGRLLRRWREGEAAISGFADGYAFMVWGLIELYETTFEVRYLREALALTRQMEGLFWDGESGGLYFTARDSEELFSRNKQFYDGALPAANSVAALNLLRLGRITADQEMEERAGNLMAAGAAEVLRYPA